MKLNIEMKGGINMKKIILVITSILLWIYPLVSYVNNNLDLKNEENTISNIN